MTNHAAARAYCKSLKSEKKRDYAWQYLSWRIFDPSREPNDNGLGTMAKQAVRMNVDAALARESK